MAFPGTYNFNYYAGDRYDFIIEPKTQSGQVFDLTGYTATFSIATSRNFDAIELSSVSEELVAEVNEGNSYVSCQIIPEYGDTLVNSSYVYDVEIDNGVGNVYTLLTGTITVTQDIS
jgi:hypothetical protein